MTESPKRTLKGRKPIRAYINDEARDRLDAIAEERKVFLSDVIEHLILHGTPPPHRDENLKE